MEYEIDFLPVGDGEKSGDAICLRYSFDDGESWHVGVIDGGTQVSGEDLCSHIRAHYKTTIVDFMICTHPDKDHASGLSVVLENLDVKKVLMHCPWDYADYIFDAVSDGRTTKQSLRQKLIDGHPYAYRVYEKAIQKGIPIHHPFSDSNHHGIPSLIIAGPSVSYYLNKLVNFRSISSVTEDQKEEEAGLLKALLEASKRAVNWVAESWDDEKLVDPADDATSSENNSSVIAFFDFEGKRVLFTADAGVEALDEAATNIEGLGYPLQSFSFFQIPHHGSKRNIGPTVLNRLVGYPKPFGSTPHFLAFVSAAKEGDPKHPNKRVTNAIQRRGGKVIATKGSTKYLFTSGTPDRGWSTAEPLPFYYEVEDND